jgi:ADP-heptose:LPS heptosyltransferase
MKKYKIMKKVLILTYCDLLGDYLHFRHVFNAILPVLKNRFDAVVWVCNPGVAKLSAVLDPDWSPFVAFVPTAEEDWKRLTLKRMPKLWFHRQSLMKQMDALGIPRAATEVWCPSVAPFEDNVINALITAKRKLGRTLESWNLNLLQHAIYTELFHAPDINEFIVYQHNRFYEQALGMPLPPIDIQPITTLPAACFHAELTQQLAGKPYVAIFPESAGSYKEWPADRFAQLINAVAEVKPGLMCVLVGQKPDNAQVIVSQLSPAATVINAIGQTNVLQTMGLIQQSQWVVCNDSFPLHAANALARPFVCIANGQFEGRYYPYPEALRFSPHLFVKPAHNGDPLTTISVSSVLNACLNVLNDGNVTQTASLDSVFI